MQTQYTEEIVEVQSWKSAYRTMYSVFEEEKKNKFLHLARFILNKLDKRYEVKCPYPIYPNKMFNIEISFEQYKHEDIAKILEEIDNLFSDVSGKK